HQDAIAKGMAYRQEKQLETWSVPYLPIDPEDVGRTYDSDVIRINSQSGKGGVSYILKQSFGIALPDKMKEEFGYLVKDVSDKEHKELTPEWIYSILEYNYVDVKEHFTVDEFHFMQKHGDGGILGIVTMTFHGQTQTITAEGNGRLDAVSKALKKGLGFSYELTDYKEHSLSKGSSSKAMSYVAITHMGRLTWGIGIDDDIIESSIEALCAAINRLPVWSK
ncbi:MAG: 2-isopropylmalate synthase, partial [Peptococcaceae bacterium]|nr:2-isopropylmalate synthase [Peptococcaceae bacterium]